MNEYLWVKEKIEKRFNQYGYKHDINLLRGDKTFEAKLVRDGVEVSNLANSPFLSFEVFMKTIELLEREGGIAKKGYAMNSKLGEEKLGLNTIEGYIAAEVYGKNIGESVFRRITPIVNILIWCEICENGKGILKLV